MTRPAIVLTAGLGTRLQPLTSIRAKPAMPVAGVPMVRRIIAWLVRHGVTDLVLNLHHLPETLTSVVGDGSDLGARVRYSWEQPRVLGSAGGPRQALPLLGAESFFIVNGDTLTDLDLSLVAEAHDASDALVTLALVPNRDFEHYGGVQVDAEGRVTGFVPRGPRARDTWHFIGVQAAHASVFAGLEPGEPARTVGVLYDALIGRTPDAIRAFCCDAKFWDVGTADDYVRMSRAFEADAGDASGSIVWNDVHIEAGATVENCIVTDGVRVPAGAVYRRAILIANAEGGITATPFGTDHA